jgi:hypothetical protein
MFHSLLKFKKPDKNQIAMDAKTRRTLFGADPIIRPFFTAVRGIAGIIHEFALFLA